MITGGTQEFHVAHNWYSGLYAQGRYQEALRYAEKALWLGVWVK